MPLNNTRNSSTPSPSGKVRGIRLFRAISRRISRRSDEDSSSSSSDSDCGSSRLKSDSGFRSVSPNQMSSSSSSSSVGSRPRHHHSTSAESVRNVLQHLSLQGRSQSCANAKESKAKQPPKRILRQPTTYAYVKGLSGLPTQRVPRAAGACGCGMRLAAGLHR